MLILLEEDGSIYNVTGYREEVSIEKIDNITGTGDHAEYRIYDQEIINRVWQALDTGGIVQIELDENNEPIGVITENGDLEPAEEVPPTPPLSDTEKLGIELSEREINEIIHGRQISDLEIRLLMGGL